MHCLTLLCKVLHFPFLLLTLYISHFLSNLHENLPKFKMVEVMWKSRSIGQISKRVGLDNSFPLGQILERTCVFSSERLGPSLGLWFSIQMDECVLCCWPLSASLTFKLSIERLWMNQQNKLESTPQELICHKVHMMHNILISNNTFVFLTLPLCRKVIDVPTEKF